MRSLVSFDLRVHPKKQLAYFPKAIVKTLGFELKAIPNAKAMVVYPKNADLKTVIKSLKIILQDLELRVEESGDEGAF